MLNYTILLPIPTVLLNLFFLNFDIMLEGGSYKCLFDSNWTLFLLVSFDYFIFIMFVSNIVGNFAFSFVFFTFINLR